MMNEVTYVVYWQVYGNPRCFETNSLTEALEQCEYARQRLDCSFVTMVADNSNCTSLSGAAVATEYDWKKRR